MSEHDNQIKKPPRGSADIDNIDTDAIVSEDLFIRCIKDNYSRYIQKSYGYLKCKSLAEDAVQDGILAAHKNLHTLKTAEALGGWLNTIIIRKSIDQLRKSKTLPKFDDNIDSLISYSQHGLLHEPLWMGIQNPEQDIMRKENTEKLLSVLESLDDTYRIPMLLKDYDGFSIIEISELLNITESNVKVRIHRARTKVKLALGDYFYPNQNRDKRD